MSCTVRNASRTILRILGLYISQRSIRLRDEKSIKKLRQARVTLQREDYVTRRIRFLSNFN